MRVKVFFTSGAVVNFLVPEDINVYKFYEIARTYGGSILRIKI